MGREAYGFAAVVSAALMWGVGGAVAKFLFNQAVSPFLLVKIRLTIACLILAVGLTIYNRRLLRVSRADLPYFVGLGMGGMAMLQFTFYYTISLTNVATAIFLQYLAPVLMAVYGAVWEKERLGLQRSIAVALATLGGLFIMLDSGGSAGLNIPGIVLGLTSAVFMAFYTVYGRRGVRTYHPVTAALYTFGFAAIFGWLVAPGHWEPGAITTDNWYMFMYVAVFSTVVPFILYSVGIKYLPPTNVGVTACLEPVVAAIVAYFALDEKMGMLQLAGGAFVIAAVVLLQSGREVKKEALQTPEA